MKTAFKRVLSFLLVLTMVFGTVGAEISGIDFADIFSFNAEAASYSGTCGDNVNWSLDTSTGVLDITGTGAMKDYMYYSSIPWYSYCSSIKTVNIASGVTSIGDSAFRYCRSLTSITIPDSVTTIGDYAFGYCDSLTSITIPDSVTTIGSYAFDNCDKLTSIIIPDSVTSIGDSAFRYCRSLTSITIPDSVTYIGEYAFYYCDSLTSVTIPDSVTSIGDSAFSGCTSLANVKIGNGVKTIGDYAFTHCSKLTSISIPDFVIKIGINVFYYCKNLKSITVDENNVRYSSDKYGVLFNKDKTTLIQYPIGNTRVNYTIPDSVTTIGYRAFDNCDKLTSIIIPDSVTSIGDEAFSGCTSLTSVTIPDSVTSIGDSAFRDSTNLKSVTIPDSVTSIGDEAFSGCTSLTSVTIPDSVTSIGERAFNSCNSLTGIYVDENNENYFSDEYGVLFNKDKTTLIKCSSRSTGANHYAVPESVTVIEKYAFYRCGNLISIELPDGLLTICDRAFGYCASLINVRIPDSVTSVGSSVFEFCKNLRSVILPRGMSYVDNWLFYRCDNLETVHVPTTVNDLDMDLYDTFCICSTSEDCYAKTYADNNNIKFRLCDGHINDVTVSGKCGNNLTWTLNITKGVLDISGTGAIWDSEPKESVIWHDYAPYIMSVNITGEVTSIGDSVFSGCRSLTSITIPDSVTSIGDSAFRDSTNLKSVTIPDSVISIGDYAFSECANLKSVTIPDSVTSIGDSVFSGCRSLTSITIPDGVTSIGDSAFSDCYSLTSVTIPDSVISIGSYAFSDCTSLTSFTIPDSVTSFRDSALYNCKNIESVNIGKGLISFRMDSFEDYLFLEKITVDEGNEYLSSDKYGVLFNKDKTTLIQYPSGNTRTSYTIPDSVTSIGAEAFSECANLKSVTIPDSVTSIGAEAFSECANLKSITIPDRVTTIGAWAFYNCDSLTSITIPDSVTSIGDSAFRYCTSLTSITVDPDNAYYSNDEYGVLFNKDKTTLIQYPIGNTRVNYTIPDSVTTIGDYAFYYCTSLTSVTIGDSVTSIGDSAFRYCTSLTSVTIGDSVTSIGDSAFRYCTSLISLIIGNGVTSIERNVFGACTNLEFVHIPASVTSISKDMHELPDDMYFCSDTEDCYAKTYAREVYRDFKLCDAHDIIEPEKVLTGIQVNTMPTKTTYYIGETFDITGLTLNAAYSDSTTEIITSGFDYSVTQLNSYGTKTVTVTYLDKSCTFSIYVSEKELPGYSVGDIIEFGSYPQGRVTDQALLSELNALWLQWVSYEYYSGWGSYYDSHMKPDDYMKYADVTYNGSKYRAVKISDYRPDNTGGSNPTGYETIVPQRDNGYTEGINVYWFRYEPLKWRVLDPVTGLVLCENLIDTQPYTNIVKRNSSVSDERYSYYLNDYVYANRYYGGGIWKWLNEDFYDIAFTESESEYIKVSEIENKCYSPLYPKLDCPSSEDKVFLLSYSDVQNSNYGFSSATAASSTRYAIGTDYAECQGLYVDDNPAYNANAEWWLRTAGDYSSKACWIESSGEVKYDRIVNDILGVRPALTLNGVPEVPDVTKIEINTLPEKTHYIAVDRVNTRGLTLLVTYSNGATGIVSDGFTCSPPILDNTCVQTITVNYRGQTCSFDVNVKAFEHSVGDVIQFGSYPQSEVTDADLISELNSLPLEWISYGYYSDNNMEQSRIEGTMQPGDWMKYADVEYGDKKYRAVLFTEYRSRNTNIIQKEENSFQDDNGYYTDVVYWFEFEPLNWRVLDPEEGYIVCESLIDAQPLSNVTYQKDINWESYLNTFNSLECENYASDYETSSIRAWLNQSFYNIAFTEEEKAQICATALDNECVHPDRYYLDSDTTYDKIFLMSFDDVIRSSYGFDKHDYSSSTRTAKGTEYAKCQGLSVDINNRGCSQWLLRTPSYDSFGACTIASSGYVYYTNPSSACYTLGIRPALKFNPQVISKLGIFSSGVKTEYTENDTLYTNGMKLWAILNDGTERHITSGFTCSPTKLTTAGKQTIKVTYGGAECTFNVIVNEIEIVGLEVKTLPTKTEYFVGDTLNTTGLTLTATYNDGTTKTITSGFTCSPTKLNTAGKQTITVTYGGKSCTFDVTVKAVELVKIEIKTLPTKTEYFVGDALNTTGLTLTATYDNGKTETTTSGFTYSPTTLETIGKQTITVTYGGKTCTFDVEVEQKDYSVTYMVNGKRYAKHIVTVGDPVPAPAVNPIVDGMIFEGWSPEIVQLMPANDLVYTAVFHKHVYTGSIAIHPTCTQHGVMLYTCSCGDSYNEIIPALGHDWGRWITVVEATPSSNGQQVRYCSRCGAEEYSVIPAPSANFRVEPIADQEYTGFGLYPAVKVYSLSGKRLDEYDHYEVSYENNIDCGVATATVKGVGEYSGVIKVNFNIIKKDIANLSFAEIPDVTYSGDAYTPDPVIYYGDILLVKDVDYTVSYSANVNIGKATITITGIGNYIGTKVIYFNISKNSTSFSVPVISSQVYTGKAVTPDFNLFSGDKLLIKGVDYTVTYENNVNVGYGKIIIKGIGNYSGTIVVIFRIVSTQISLATVPSFRDIAYDGNEFTPDFNANPITYGGKKLVEGVDFKVEIYNNRNAGTVKIVIIGIGNFTGTIVIYVNINAVDISGVTVSRIDDVEYNGAAQTPSFRVTKNGKTLIKGVDYTVEFRNNISVGTATVVIKGIGNYKGEKSFTFRIVESTYYELTVTTESETLGYDSTMQVYAEVNPYLDANYTFVYESSNVNIASVDENGIVKALDEGEVIITVTVVDENGNHVLNTDGDEISSTVKIKCTMTFWQKIIRFFRSIAAFFTNLFTF